MENCTNIVALSVRGKGKLLNCRKFNSEIKKTASKSIKLFWTLVTQRLPNASTFSDPLDKNTE